MTRLLPLWVGARGVEFDWKYMQMSFDANISLVSLQPFLSLCLWKILKTFFFQNNCFYLLVRYHNYVNGG